RLPPALALDRLQALAELALRPGLVPVGLTAKRLPDLAALDVAELDCPGGTAPGGAANDGCASRHGPPRVSGSRWDAWLVSPERARFLLGNPAYDRLVAIANVVPELDVGDATAAGVLAHPAHRDAQQLGDVGCGEEALNRH